MRTDARNALSLFSTPRVDRHRQGATQHVDDRPIARNAKPPQHQPTSLVPPTLLKPLTKDEARLVTRKTDEVVAQIEKWIGKPYFSADGFVLFRGDSGEAMQTLAEGDFAADLTVTSPPYNIGKEYEQVRSTNEYVDWCASWIKAVHRITAPNGSFWLNLGYLPIQGKGKAVPIPYLLWDRTSFFLLQEIVWNYGAGVTTKRGFAPRNEKWLFYVKNELDYTFNLDAVRDPNVKYPNQKKNGKYRCNPLGKNPSDVWQFPKVTTGKSRSSAERTAHPAQFPLGVVERIVRASSNSGGVVVDPFSGSGSTGIAALGSGRVYVGFEIDSSYCKLTVERVKQFLRMR